MAFVLCDSTHCFSAGTHTHSGSNWREIHPWGGHHTTPEHTQGLATPSSGLIRVGCACALIASLPAAVPGWKTKVTHTITLICLFTLVGLKKKKKRNEWKEKEGKKKRRKKKQNFSNCRTSALGLSPPFCVAGRAPLSLCVAGLLIMHATTMATDWGRHFS